MRYLILVLLSSSVALGASDRIRLYDEKKGTPHYSGYAEKQWNGDWRFYDQYGQYKGRMDVDRFYSRDGKVLQKYYLFNERK